MIRDVDDAAHASPWRDRPIEVLALCAALLAASLLTRSGWGNAALAVVGAVAALRAGAPWRTWTRLWAGAMGFGLLGSAALTVSVHPSGGGAPLSWNPDGVALAARALARSAAAVSALLVASFAVPFPAQLEVLRRLRVPEACLELAASVRRSLFLLDETLGRIRRAQLARHGYRNLSASRRSVAHAAASLLVSAVGRSWRQERALAARGGGACVPPPSRPLRCDALRLGAALAVPAAVAWAVSGLEALLG